MNHNVEELEKILEGFECGIFAVGEDNDIHVVSKGKKWMLMALAACTVMDVKDSLDITYSEIMKEIALKGGEKAALSVTLPKEEDTPVGVSAGGNEEDLLKILSLAVKSVALGVGKSPEEIIPKLDLTIASSSEYLN